MSSISIAILAQEDNERLRRTLDSVYRQSNITLCDVVLVDNGAKSPIAYDSSVYPNLQIVRHEKDLGYSIGKNTAVANAKGEYVLLLDDDIVLSTDTYIEDIFKTYKKFNDIAFLGLLLVDEGKELTRYYGMEYTWYGLNFFRKSLSLEHARIKHEIEIGSFHGGAVFFRKKIWERLGGYDTYQPIMHDDFDISARAQLFGYKNYLYADVAVVHTGKQKDSDKKRFARKYSYFYSGFAGNIIKNYSTKKIMYTFPFFTISSILMMTALAITKKNGYIIFSFLQSFYRFFINIKVLLIKRSIFWENK